jgi:hypothetical protein
VSTTIAYEMGNGVAAMSSVIGSIVDETNFRIILFLVSQTVAVGSLAAVAFRFATSTGVDPAR